MSSEILIELYKEALIEVKSYRGFNPDLDFFYEGVKVKDDKGGKITIYAIKGEFFFSKKSGKISYFHEKLNILYNFDIYYQNALTLINLGFDRCKIIEINDIINDI